MSYHHVNKELVQGAGIITPPMCSKASQDSWTTGRNNRSRTVGVAPGAPAKNGASMLVTYADGTSEVKSLVKTRAPRSSRAAQVKAIQVAQTPRHITAADVHSTYDERHSERY